MKVISFTVNNYRSITKANKLQLDNYTVLIGPNNEGKSNLLTALVTTLNLVSIGDYRTRGTRSRYSFDGNNYVWERDIPYNMKDKTGAKTDFVLEFDLSQDEKRDFKTKIGSALNVPLSLKIQLGNKSGSFDVIIQGKAKKNLVNKKDEIAQFIKERNDFQYIPCVRTVELSTSVFDEMVSRELTKLEETQEYIDHMNKIQELQRPIIEVLQKEIAATVSEFIPDIKSIKLETSESVRRALRRSRILVDDGILTDLEAKGDGVKSLVAMALMRHLSSATGGNKNLVLCVEEPESHLHPQAIHGIRKVLVEASTKSQVILSTHSPILIDRSKPQNNIIVNAGKATPCHGVSQIRDVLGIQVSDNRISANFVLLVEGESDKRILGTILSEKVANFAQMVSDGRLVVDDLGGSSKATYKAGIYKSMLCEVHLVVDGDDSGEETIKDAVAKKVLEYKEITKVTCPGINKPEIEDLIDVKYYHENIKSEFNVDLMQKEFRQAKSKWSSRVEREFVRQGAHWDDSIKNKVKTIVADAVVQNGFTSFHSAKTGCVDALVRIIYERLSTLNV